MSQIEAMIVRLSDDAERYPVSVPVDPRQSVPIEHLYATHMHALAVALRDIDRRLSRLEYRNPPRTDDPT